MRSRPAISTRRMIGLTDRADGRASFLRAPDTVAPPVALEPDNSPSRAPGFPGNEREIGAQNLRNLAAGVRWSRRLGASYTRPRAHTRCWGRHRRGEASDGEGPLCEDTSRSNA